MQISIGERIALLRKRKDITQTDLAEYLYLAPQTVSRWETGGGTPDIALLPKIAAFFGVSTDELFGLTSLERAQLLAEKLHMWIQLGRETLSELKRDFEERPDNISLLRCISMLGHRQDYETALESVDSKAVRDIILPPSAENLPVWHELISAAARIGETGFIGRYLLPEAGLDRYFQEKAREEINLA